MYIVESKVIRETLEFRIKSLEAMGQKDSADFIREDLKSILRCEQYISCDKRDK